MPLPRVSVVLPVWNGARFLATAIESVLAQTCQSLELLVVDDGSNDATREIAKGFADRDARVTVLALGTHVGIVRALNAGIAAATGEYVARMDADDVAVPSRLETQIALLDAHPECVAVGSAVEVIDEDGQQIGEASYPERHDDIARALLAGRGATLARGRRAAAARLRMEALLESGEGHAAREPHGGLSLPCTVATLRAADRVAGPAAELHPGAYLKLGGHMAVNVFSVLSSRFSVDGFQQPSTVESRSTEN
jgi:glycosyltransferase involved in cell wall biosynthesis